MGSGNGGMGNGLDSGWRPAAGLPASGERLPLLAGHPGPLVSGHRTPRVYGPLAQTLAAGLEADRPDLAAYPEALAAWAQSEAIAALLRRHLSEVGPVDPATAQPRETSLKELARAEFAAARHRARRTGRPGVPATPATGSSRRR
jgi:hypothetical protein